MSLFNPKRIFSVLIILLLLLVAWIFFRRFDQVAMETYVPEAALGYVEVNNLPQLLDRFTTTEAWETLAPEYGLSNIHYAGWLGKLSRWTGIGTSESLLVARGQFALVITGIEVRGDEVKPRWALLTETHGSPAQIKTLMAERLPQLAARAYKQPIQEASEYSGVPVTIYRAPQGERQILSASVNSEWIIANDPEALRACIDVRQGRVPALAKNNLLPQARNAVDRNGDVFAFISSSGATRLAKFFAHLVAGKMLEGTPLTGLLEGLVEEISANSVEAIAYSASLVSAGVVDRSAILCKPEVASSLRSTIRVANQAGVEKSAAMQLVPASTESVQIVNIEDPHRALDGVEKIVAANIGAVQSFLFHRFFTTAKKTFLGIEQNENASAAVGNEVVRLQFAAPPNDPKEKDAKADHVWLVAARDKRGLATIATRLLTQQNKSLKRESYRNIEVQAAGDGKRAFAFIKNFLALGTKENVQRLIDETEKKSLLTAAPQFTASPRGTPENANVLYSFSSVAQEAGKMMEILQRRIAAKSAAKPSRQTLLEKLPLAFSTAQIDERGIHLEARSAFGNFPLIINFIDSFL